LFSNLASSIGRWKLCKRSIFLHPILVKSLGKERRVAKKQKKKKKQDNGLPFESFLEEFQNPPTLIRARKESHSREPEGLVSGAVPKGEGDGDDGPGVAWMKSKRRFANGHCSVAWLKT